MYRLTKTFRFEAAHQLVNHDGKCARLHGHSWKMTVVCEGEELETEGPKKGMLIDFGDISAEVKPLLREYLDHYHLNETLGVDDPTSEYVAMWAFNKLKPKLYQCLKAVIIEETCTSSCEYRTTPPKRLHHPYDPLLVRLD